MIMDYRESSMSIGITEKLLCSCCGGQQHSANSGITYGFYFFEYLPIFPIKRNTQVQCLQCHNLAEVTHNASDLKLVFSDFSLAFFNKLRLLSTFTGSVMIITLLSYYFSEEQQTHRQSQTYIDAPKLNDFYYLNYQKVAAGLPPHHKYRIAKIVDITGGTVSLSYGNYFYPLKKSLSDGLRFGHTRDFDYFEKTRHNFSYAELNSLFEQDFIYRVVRPEFNIIGRNSAIYMIDGNAVQAFILLKKSAELAYAPGQTNLAELYLTGIEGSRDIQTAAHWLLQAALQGYQPAIEKYRVICQLEESCQIEDFYRVLNEAGTRYEIN